MTASWHVKHNALHGFYRHAINRGFVAHSPLPMVIPKRPPASQPYIYSQAELRHLMDATSSYQRTRGSLELSTVRTLLLLMYGTALRASEALSLTNADVDLLNSVLTVPGQLQPLPETWQPKPKNRNPLKNRRKLSEQPGPPHYPADRKFLYTLKRPDNLPIEIVFEIF